VTFTQVGPEFFHALRIPLVRGRVFSPADDAQSPRVAVIDENLARQYFPGRDPVGMQIMVNEPEAGASAYVPATVIGLVRNATPRRIPELPRLYVPNAQDPSSLPELVVRLSTPDPKLESHLAKALAAVDPNAALVSLASAEQRAAASAVLAQTNAALLGILAVVALVLALGGIYAVVSYSVEQRRHEFGIRIAVGARAYDILRDVLGGAARIALLGTACGFVVAAFATRSLDNVLYVSAFDPGTFGTVGAIVLGCVIAAAAIPAVRATRVDPAVALRYE
jgi:putative ABC transport system permease protein